MFLSAYRVQVNVKAVWGIVGSSSSIIIQPNNRRTPVVCDDVKFWGLSWWIRTLSTSCHQWTFPVILFYVFQTNPANMGTKTSERRPVRVDQPCITRATQPVSAESECKTFSLCTSCDVVTRQKVTAALIMTALKKQTLLEIWMLLHSCFVFQ